MAQFIRPIADVDAGSWNDADEGDNDGEHWDELVANDDSKTESDAVGNNTNSTDLDVEGTNSGIDDPVSSSDHIIRVVWNSDQSRNITGHAELWQGVPDVGSLIAEATVQLVDTTEITTTYTLTGGEADNITDYNDLHFALWGRGTGGGPSRTLQVDLLELEIPDAPSGFNETVTDDADVTDDTSRIHAAARTPTDDVGVTDSATPQHLTTVHEGGLSNPTTGFPTVDTDHVVRFRARSVTDGDLRISIYEGASLIEEWDQTLTVTFTDYNRTLAQANVANIVNYTDLRFKVQGVSADAAVPHLSWFEFEMPDGVGADPDDLLPSHGALLGA